MILVFCMCSQIKIAVAVAKAAGSFINNTLTTLLVPFVNAILAVMTWAIGVTGIIYLLGAADWKLVNS